MIESTVELTEDFSNNLQFIADALFAKHYISPSVKEEALNPIYPTSRERASKLVSVITSRIKIQPEAFKTFVALLDPRYFRLSLTALKKKYKNRSKYGRFNASCDHPPNTIATVYIDLQV